MYVNIENNNNKIILNNLKFFKLISLTNCRINEI